MKKYTMFVNSQIPYCFGKSSCISYRFDTIPIKQTGFLWLLLSWLILKLYGNTKWNKINQNSVLTTQSWRTCINFKKITATKSKQFVIGIRIKL